MYSKYKLSKYQSHTIQKKNNYRSRFRCIPLEGDKVPTIWNAFQRLWFIPPLFIFDYGFLEFSLFSYNNGMVMSTCRELDNNRSALSAASAFAIATAGANEGTPTKEKYRRMSLASTGTLTHHPTMELHHISSFSSSCTFSLIKNNNDHKINNRRVFSSQVSRLIREMETKSLWSDEQRPTEFWMFWDTGCPNTHR